MRKDKNLALCLFFVLIVRSKSSNVLLPTNGEHMSDTSFETTVLGGFPVLVECTVFSAEPDVGYLSAYWDDYRLCSPRTGKPLGKWIDRRIDSTPGERARLEAEIDYEVMEMEG